MTEKATFDEETVRQKVIDFSKKAEIYGTNCFRIEFPKPIQLKDGESIMATFTDKGIEELNKCVDFPEYIFCPDDLRDSYKYVFPLASQMGWTSAQINKTLRDIYSIGIKDARAGTSLRFILFRLEEQGFLFESWFTKIGISYNDIDPCEHTFTEILKVFSVSNVDKDSINLMFGSIGKDFWEILKAYENGKIKDD